MSKSNLMKLDEETGIASYLQLSGLSFDESKPGPGKHELVDIDAIEDCYFTLQGKLTEVIAHYSKFNKIEDFDQALYSYCVPEMSEDGVCSYPDKLAKEPYSLIGALGSPSLANLRMLNILNDLVEIAYRELQTDWLGIYRRFSMSETPALVKLAYRGIPSRAEFPITEEFASKSNNSTVALKGAAVIINNLEVHLNKGGAFYVCDEAVRSEACLPIYSPDFSHIVGIIDAEDTKTYAYKAKELSYLVALCLVLSGVLA